MGTYLQWPDCPELLGRYDLRSEDQDDRKCIHTMIGSDVRPLACIDSYTLMLFYLLPPWAHGCPSCQWGRDNCYVLPVISVPVLTVVDRGVVEDRVWLQRSYSLHHL